MKAALIIGSEGQDGTLLKKYLSVKGYKVYAVGRSKVTDTKWLTHYIELDLAVEDYSSIIELVKTIRIDEVYYIAAFHHSSQEKSAADQFSFIDRSLRVNYLGFVKILEMVCLHAPRAKVFYTSSSLIFSGCKETFHTEMTLPNPRCIYSLSKCNAMMAAEYYRSAKNIFVSIGIMYNHESVLRKDYFLSKKIINETKEVVAGRRSVIKVGDLAAITDWGYAPDYVNAMWHILQLEKPGDYIISSGIGRTVQNWFEVLFDYLGLDWQRYVVEDKTLLQRQKPPMIGNNARLLSTGWLPDTSFEDMLIRMYNNQI